MKTDLTPTATTAAVIGYARDTRSTFADDVTAAHAHVHGATPAALAAIRAATGLELPRAPVRAQDIALG